MAGVRPSPKVYQLSVRLNQDHGGAVAPVVVDHDGLKNSGARHVLMFVHGYNNSAAEARTSYALQMNCLKTLQNRNNAPDAIAHFQWPGDLPGPFIGTDWSRYADDIPQAIEAAARLAIFVADLPRPNGDARALKLSFIGHSMGCRLILEALYRLSDSKLPKLEVASFMAAAAGVPLVAANGRLRTKTRDARAVLKFFSEWDVVLRLGFPLGQLLAYQRGIEPENYSEAIGLHGNPSDFGAPNQTTNGHSKYWGDEAVANIFMANIDPALRQLPDPRALADRDLSPPNDMPEREILTRDLPT